MPDKADTDPASSRATPPHGSALRFAQLLAARMSHDLAGLTGVLAGALELATEEAEPAEALGFARDAASELAARLRLLRAAWAGAGTPLSAAELTALAPGLGPRVQLDHAGLGDTPYPPGLSRMLPNLLLLGAEALPRGGVVALSGNPGEAATPGWVRLAVTGARAAWPDTLAACIAAPDTAWAISAPRQLQPALVVLLAHTAGLDLRFEACGPDMALPPLRVSGGARPDQAAGDG